MNGAKQRLGFLGAAVLWAACGQEVAPARPRAALELPAARQARIAITPALDVSGLYDARLADRIALEEVTINLADARLLGADPRLPAGGLDLVEGEAQVTAYGGDELGLLLPFPEYLLTEDDLAVYVRIDPSATLDGASVLVRGRVYADAYAGGQSSLTSAPDPDGDPAHEVEAKGGARRPSSVGRRGDSSSIDPDGDPARPCSPDPDGDPARPACNRGALVARSQDQRSVPFELRGADAAELVAHLQGDSTLDVVVGVPAARWFSRETVARLERLLAERPATGGASPRAPDERAARTVLEPRAPAAPGASTRVPGGEEGGYFLSDDPSLGGLKIRRGD